jgi:hypothetical protein
MTVCYNCQGIKYTVPNNVSIQTYAGSMVFTAPKQGPAIVTCPICLGTGINTQAGS